MDSIDADALTTRLDTGSTAALPAIGPYRLLRKVGEGAMGVVYEATQEQPVRRRVALKLVRAGLDTAGLAARFEIEREALALMDHPGIARVLDAGLAADGTPYFAMEFVDGIPLTTYCERFRLPVRERLTLLIRVCEAVQHAHQKGIIHRDLKPSNVLVGERDGVPEIKVIDFGVARALGRPLSARGASTEFGQLVGTPEYMSPEQAEPCALGVDTRADVYALGVLLYELLTGTLPFGRRDESTGVFEVLRRIREDDPERPSVRSGLRELRGDLDWITLKALAKERSRRYGSASDLAADLALHLMDEPVVARPASVAYRATKFARRHRVGVAAGVLVVLTLAGASVVSTAALWRARAAERTARADAETARRVSEFMEGLFRVSEPARGETVTARELLDRGAARIDDELNEQPLVQSRLMTTMGRVYGGLGIYPRARTLLERSLALRERELGASHPDVATSANDLGALLFQSGNYAEARRLFERVLAIREAERPRNELIVAMTLNNLAAVTKATGDIERARALFARNLELIERIRGPEHVDLVTSLSNLANVERQSGHEEAARTLLERALRIAEAGYGPDHERVAAVLVNLAITERKLGHPARTRELYERALRISERAFGGEHPRVAGVLNNLAIVLRELGELDAAEDNFRRALAIWESRLGPQHPDVALALSNIGDLRVKRGDLAEADRLYARAVAIYEAALGPAHPDLSFPLSGRARVALASGRTRDAVPLFARALEVRRATLPANHPDVKELERDYQEALRRAAS